MKYTLYHGSVESFNCFDESKINHFETDALYNGFWFSSDKFTSPAWKNPRYLKKCNISLNYPAPQKVIKEIIADLKNSSFEGHISLQDAVRLKLVSLGYDGIILMYQKLMCKN